MEVVPKVTFAHLDKTVEFESGKLPYHEHGKPESILDVALNFGINLEHACGGVCACTTCHVHVTKGKENLSPEEDDQGRHHGGYAGMESQLRERRRRIVEPGQCDSPAKEHCYFSA